MIIRLLLFVFVLLTFLMCAATVVSMWWWVCKCADVRDTQFGCLLSCVNSSISNQLMRKCVNWIYTEIFSTCFFFFFEYTRIRHHAGWTRASCKKSLPEAMTNEMLIGQARKFINQKVLDQYLVHCSIAHKFTWNETSCENNCVFWNAFSSAESNEFKIIINDDLLVLFIFVRQLCLVCRSPVEHIRCAVQMPQTVNLNSCLYFVRTRICMHMWGKIKERRAFEHRC